MNISGRQTDSFTKYMKITLVKRGMKKARKQFKRK